jgi:hypothetical protein
VVVDNGRRGIDGCGSGTADGRRPRGVPILESILLGSVINNMKIKNKDANATELQFKNGNIFFFSYETPVAARINSHYYKTSKYHSKTTSRHINRFLHGDTVGAVEKPQFFFDEEMEKITR